MWKHAILALLFPVAVSALELTPSACTRLCEAHACDEHINHVKFSRCSKALKHPGEIYCWCVYYANAGDDLIFRCLDAGGKVLATAEDQDQCGQTCTTYEDDKFYNRAATPHCKGKEPAPPKAPDLHVPL